jgi:cell filamentation protein
MYDEIDDPYCYPGTSVLKNIPGFDNQAALDAFEAASTMQRADEALPSGRLTPAHYRSIHRHLFQDVYEWAGRFRTVRLSKGKSAFCYPEHIEREVKKLFSRMKSRLFFRGLSAGQFAREAAEFLSELNAIHPFREGNGRTQLTFLTLLADQAGHPLDLEKLNANQFLQSMVLSFRGDITPLMHDIRALIN